MILQVIEDFPDVSIFGGDWVYPGEVEGCFSTLDVNAFSSCCFAYCVVFMLDVDQSSDVDICSNVPGGVGRSIPNGSDIWFGVKYVSVDGYLVAVIVMWVCGVGCGPSPCGWVDNMGFT